MEIEQEIHLDLTIQATVPVYLDIDEDYMEHLFDTDAAIERILDGEAIETSLDDINRIQPQGIGRMKIDHIEEDGA